MDKLITTNNGGFPLALDDIRYILGQDSTNPGIYEALEGMLLQYGTDFIVSGCVAAGAPGAITAGWIMLNSELIRVDAHTGSDTYYEKVTTTDESKTFQDGSTASVYQHNRATSSAAAGTLAYNGDTLLNKIRINNTSAASQSIVSGAITTSPTAVVSRTASTTKSTSKLNIIFSCTVQSPVGGSNQVLTITVKNGASSIKTAKTTIFTDGRWQAIAVSIGEIPYTAGTSIDIIGQMDGNICTISDVDLTTWSITE